MPVVIPKAQSQLAAVVLAGGASRRMGRDKAAMAHPEKRGQSMLEHTVAVLTERCSPIFVVAAPGQSVPAIPGVVVLRDQLRSAGPLPATGLGLRAAADAGADRAFVCAVDMPLLSAGLIDDLAGCSDADIVVPWDGQDHYLAGIYRTGLAADIESLVAAGARSMRVLADAVVTQRVVLPPTPALTNINSEADLSLGILRSAR